MNKIFQLEYDATVKSQNVLSYIVIVLQLELHVMNNATVAGVIIYKDAMHDMKLYNRL